jgi:hypothetical protein
MWKPTSAAWVNGSVHEAVVAADVEGTFETLPSDCCPAVVELPWPVVDVAAAGMCADPRLHPANNKPTAAAAAIHTLLPLHVAMSLSPPVQ